MADVNANIGVNIDTSSALAQLKSLQREISRFHSSVAKSSEAATLAQRDLQRNFVNGVNAIQGFSAELRTVKTTAESFTDSLEKNKFSMREYFRYSIASTKTFGRLFRTEFDTINKVSLENVKRLQTQYIKMGRDANGVMKAIAIMPTKLDLTDLTTQTQIAAQKQALFNQLVKQGSTNLLNFGKNTQWAGRQLMVGFTLPLISLGSVASKTFMDMETAAIKFRKVYGDLFTPAEEREQAFADIEALGKEFTKYGIAVSDTINLAAEAAAAGFQGVDLQRQTTEATRLQVLGQIDQQKALDTTISLQNAFRMSSEDLADAINFLNAVENQTVVSLDDVTTAIPKAAPIVKELGGDVKDLAFFLAAMREGGINASEGANALKSGLASLINPTDKAKGMLADFGINIDAIVEKNVGNVKQTVIDFAVALDGLSSLSRQRAIEQLFGKFQQARLSALFTNVIRDGNQASRVLDLAGSSTEELATLAEQELGITASSAMNKFKSSVENLKVSLAPVGKIFLEIITPFLENIGELFDKFNNLSDGTKKVITGLIIGIGAIAPIVLMTVGLFANFIANGIKGLMLLRNGYLRLTGQSQILSEQTNYLTVEQQQALAAAASLEQSHMNLKQVFTGEAAAVRALVTEYQRMIAAQNTAAARFPGMMQPGFKAKGYAKGIVSVPGPKGAGDIIPAMVSPGEAIISAAMNKKYAPLVQGIIADNIPGFKRGSSNISDSGSFSKNFGQLFGDVGRLWAAPTTISSQTEKLPNWSTLDDEIAVIHSDVRKYLESLGDSEELIQQKLANLTRIQASHKEKQTFSTNIGGELRDIKIWQSGNLQKDLGAINNFLNVVPKIAKTLDDAKIAELASRIDISVGEFKEELQQLEDGIHPSTQRSADVLLEVAKEGASVDPSLARTKTQRTELEKQKYQSIAAKSLLQKRKEGDYYSPESMEARAYDPSKDEATMLQTLASVEKVRSEFVNSFSLSDEIAEISGKNTQALQAAWDQLSIAQKEGLLSLKNDPVAFTNALLDEAKNAGIAGFELGSSAIDGMKRATGSASPSIKAKQEGDNVVDGYEQAILEGMDDVSLAASKLNQAATNSLYQPALPRLVGANIAQGPSSPVSSINEFTNVTAEATKVTKASSDNIAKWNSRLMSSSFAISGITGIASMFGNKLGGVGDMAFKVSTAMFALQSITQALTSTQMLKLAQDRLQIAQGAALSAAQLGMGRGGQIAMFSRALFTAINPLTKIALVVGAGVLAYKFINSRIEESRRKIDGLGDAAKLSADKMKSLGDFFGVKTREGALGRDIPEVTVSRQERTNIQQFRESSAFKDLEPEIKSLREATNKEAGLALKSLAINLKGAGYAEEQVQTIINAMQEAAGKTDLKINVKSFNISTEDGMKNLKKTVSGLVDNVGKQFADGYSEKTLSAVSRATGEVVTWTEKTLSQGLKRSISAAGKSISSIIDGLAGQLESGEISAEQFASAMSGISKQLESMPTPQALLITDKIFESLPKKLASAAGGLTNVSNRMLILEAKALGLQGELYGVIAAMKILEGGAAYGPEGVLQTIAAQEAFDKFIKELKNRRKKIQEIAKDALDDEGISTSGEDKKIEYFGKELDLLEKKRNKLKEVNSELDRQNQYQMKQMDLINQASRAKISGDFLQAAQLQQQSMFEGAQFVRESQELQFDKLISRLQRRGERAEDRGRYNNKDRQIKKQLRAGNYDSIVPMAKTPTVGFNAGAVGFSGSTATVGGAMYSMTFNITGVDAQNTDKIKDAVLNAIKVAENKKNKSNKVR